MTTSENVCVYTCITGDYETLNELPAEGAPDIARICFTDNPSLESKTWTIRLIEATFPIDSVRSQRRIKILAHEYLPEFDLSLYVDNSVGLQTSPDKILETLRDDADLAAPLHSYHSSVLDEFIAVADHGLDEPARIFEQLNHYQLSLPEVLDETPFWTAIMVRRHNDPSVRAAMTDWYNQVIRYSRRDQLSCNYALRRAGVRVQPFEIDNHRSWMHEWPVASNRKTSARVRNFAMAGMSAVAQQRLTQIQLESASSNLNAANSGIAGLQDELAAARGELEVSRQNEASQQHVLRQTEENLQAVQHHLQSVEDQLRATQGELLTERHRREQMEVSTTWRARTALHGVLERHPFFRRVAGRLNLAVIKVASMLRVRRR